MNFYAQVYFEAAVGWNQEKAKKAAVLCFESNADIIKVLDLKSEANTEMPWPAGGDSLCDLVNTFLTSL